MAKGFVCGSPARRSFHSIRSVRTITRTVALALMLCPAGSQAVDTITTFAGIGWLPVGYSGDGGAATSARLNSPTGVAVDGAGNVYIADAGNDVIRKVEAGTGIITSYLSGTSNPQGVAVDGAGNLYVADTGNNVVWKVTVATEVVTLVAGTGGWGYSGDGGLATGAELDGPEAVAVDGSGNVYIADTNNNVIRKVAAGSGIITTYAGTGYGDYYGDGGLATDADLYSPASVTVDGSGNLYIADFWNSVIRKVAAGTGIITTCAGTWGAVQFCSYGVAVDGAGNLYFSSYLNNAIIKVAGGTGIMTTVAGKGGTTGGYSGDGGAATNAEFDRPHGVAVGGSGNLFIADTVNSCIRKVTMSVISGTSLGDAVDNTGLVWSTGGDASWSGESAVKYYGSFAAQSGDVGDGQSTYLQTTVTGPADLSFYWKVDSESGYDYLTVLLDGTAQPGAISGSVDWTLKTVSIPAGSHTVRWEYSKDPSVSSGADAGWVDKVSLSAPAAPICSGVDAALGQIIFCDDFSGSSLDASKWLSGGSSVSQAGGILTISEDITDTYAHVNTVPLDVPRVAVRFRHWMSPANAYFMPSITLRDIGNNAIATLVFSDSSFSLDYCSDPAKFNRVLLRTTSQSCIVVGGKNASSYYNRWTETLFSYDSNTGNVTVDLDNDGVIDLIYNIPPGDRRTVHDIRIDTYGWWTGHMHKIDYIAVGTGVGTGPVGPTRSPTVVVTDDSPTGSTIAVDSGPPLYSPKGTTVSSSSNGHLEIWDGVNGFVPYASGLFHPAYPTIVLIHGWAPGNRYMLSGAIKEPELQATWVPQAAAVLSARSNLNILAWNWLETASTRSALVSILVSGELMIVASEVYDSAVALSNQLRGVAGLGAKPVHLWGHSLGASIAATVAVSMPRGIIDQVTLADPPETGLANNGIDDIHVQLDDQIRILHGLGVWVDYYISQFGKAREDAANFNFMNETPDIVFNHGYPCVWYFGTPFVDSLTGTIDSTSGCEKPIGIGAALSLALNCGSSGNEAVIRATRESMVDNTGGAVLEYRQSDKSHPYNLIPIDEPSMTQHLLTISDTFNLRSAENASGWFWRTVSNGASEVFDGLKGAAAWLTKGSPSVLTARIAWPRSALYFTVDISNVNASDTDSLMIYFRDQPLLQLMGKNFPPPGASVTVSAIDLTRFAGQEGDLTFIYNGTTAGQTIVLRNPVITVEAVQPTVPSTASIVNGKLTEGHMIVAPNVLNLSVSSSALVFYARGNPNGVTTITVYDEAGGFFGKLTVPLDGSGLGHVNWAGTPLGGHQAGTGVYWAVASGSGVNDKKPFSIVRKR